MPFLNAMNSCKGDGKRRGKPVEGLGYVPWGTSLFLIPCGDLSGVRRWGGVGAMRITYVGEGADGLGNPRR